MSLITECLIFGTRGRVDELLGLRRCLPLCWIGGEMTNFSERGSQGEKGFNRRRTRATEGDESK